MLQKFNQEPERRNSGSWFLYLSAIQTFWFLLFRYLKREKRFSVDSFENIAFSSRATQTILRELGDGTSKEPFCTLLDFRFLMGGLLALEIRPTISHFVPTGQQENACFVNNCGQAARNRQSIHQFLKIRLLGPKIGKHRRRVPLTRGIGQHTAQVDVKRSDVSELWSKKTHRKHSFLVFFCIGPCSKRLISESYVYCWIRYSFRAQMGPRLRNITPSLIYIARICPCV